ncbi:MAG: hypothetical protein B7C24_10120 [Bacteroidetes bacterium 4572_77]|nr:MAG: hypothetical protein B7C24_10120 [Bacteroidetes bacterium 4572_77]
MTRVALLVDNRGWAYDTKANALIDNYKGNRFKFEIVGYKDDPNFISEVFARNDYYLCFGFQNFKKCEKRHGAIRKNTLASVASHASWDHGETQPTNQVLPDKNTIRYLSSFKSISTVSKRLQKLFKQAGLNTYYTPNGVPTTQFTPVYEFKHSNKLVVGYAGRDRDVKKGNKTFIEPAAKQLSKKVDLKLALCDFRKEKSIGHRGELYHDYKDMPQFYKDLDVYICMSREEGSCRSVLEAMASGCAIISTDCGAINELIVHGKNGLIVDRNKSALVAGLVTLHRNRELVNDMKHQNREFVKNFDWSVVSSYWYKWMEETI